VTLPQDLSPSIATDLKNAPTTSVDVERSFSIYKTIITALRRTNFTPENLEKYIIVHSFKSIVYIFFYVNVGIACNITYKYVYNYVT